MKGMTLIETLIYISLLSILMVGVFSSVYVVIDSGEKKHQIDVQKDTELLLKNYHE